jgi:uncharacterized protein YggE
MSLKNWVFSLGLMTGLAFSLPLGAQETDAQGRIVVVGEGQVSAAPDKAVITLGARHSAQNAAVALEKTNMAVQAILSRMKELGVDPADMQTSSLSLNPIWGKTRSYENGDIAAPKGFEASNTVQVTLRDLERLGEVLDQVAEEGANSFSGFRFGVIDPQPLLDAARKAAVSDARRKAELYALAAGVSLGKVVLISEDTSSGAGYPAPVMEMAMSRAGGVPIAQGEVTQSARIKLVFELNE